jgi:hypothetical protein
MTPEYKRFHDHIYSDVRMFVQEASSIPSVLNLTLLGKEPGDVKCIGLQPYDCYRLIKILQDHISTISQSLNTSSVGTKKG